MLPERLEQKRIRREKFARLFGIFVLLIAFSIFFISQFEPVQRKVLYPYPHQEIVEKYALKFKVDSSLAASVIMKESKFKNEAVSHRGALGLMQIMPETAKWIAEQHNEKEFSLEKLSDPEINIRFGVWYLSSLQHEFRNNEILVLAAYNAGRGTVHEWMEEYGWGYDFNDPKQIPYDETRNYVLDVLKGKAKYRKLYHQ